jgi:anaphase-promoting complex subunit 3
MWWLRLTRGLLVQILERKNSLEEALAEYQRASRLRPDIHMYPFRCASVLLSLNRLEEALAVLNPVKDADPAECNVHFLLGRIYKKMGKKDLAIRAFTMAQDSSGARISAAIKEEIGKAFFCIVYLH